MKAIVCLALCAIALPAVAEPPTPGLRARSGPNFEIHQMANGQSWSNRPYLLDAIRDATDQLVPRLNGVESIVIYAIDPHPVDRTPNGRTDRHYFHGYKILGSKTLWKEADLTWWRKELTEGVSLGSAVLCFDPRHAIRIHTRHTTIDMVLCFECGQMKIYGLGPGPQWPRYFFDFMVLDSLNELLDAHGIPRDKPDR